MRNRRLKLLALAIFNACVYHFAYVDFLNPVFEYAGFRYEATSTAWMIWTYAAAVLPILVSRESNEPSAVGCGLIYGLSYIPIQLTLAFMWAQKDIELFLIQLIMALSMTMLFRSSAPGRLVATASNRHIDLFLQSSPLTSVINVLSVVGLVMIVAEFHSIMKFVSFADVYDLRSDAAGVQASTLTNYLMMWLTYCFGPFYMARALLYGKKLDWLFGLAIFIVVYGAIGSKLALLTPLFMCAMRYLDNGRDEFLVRFLTVIGAFVGLIALMIPEEGILRWVNAIFLMRVFGTNGWNAAAYYEYFSSHGYTFYSHIGVVNALFGNYPYGDRSLGQEIGKFYLNSDEVNMNAGFWASDGFAALGMLGVPVVTVFASMFMKRLDQAAQDFPLRLINLWMLGFWMALMNIPLPTALVSCGGLMIVFLLRYVRRRIELAAVYA